MLTTFSESNLSVYVLSQMPRRKFIVVGGMVGKIIKIKLLINHEYLMTHLYLLVSDLRRLLLSI